MKLDNNVLFLSQFSLETLELRMQTHDKVT